LIDLVASFPVAQSSQVSTPAEQDSSGLKVYWP